MIALCTLIFCSCRHPAGSRCSTAACPQGASESLPPEAYSGAVAAAGYAAPVGPPGMEQGVPHPYSPRGPWAPPGIKQPWPEDEYLRDGGDEGRPAGVHNRTEVLGVGVEDTVAHYDTVDGRTLVEPSNKVYVYSPRFGAVRQVVSLAANEDRLHVGGVHNPQKLDAPTTLQLVSSAKQHTQPNNEIAARPAVAMRSKQGDGAMSSAVGPRGFQDRFKPYENLAIIRRGSMEMAEMPFLAHGSQAAIAWSNTQAVQVILEARGAMAAVKYDASSSVYTYTAPPGNPQLRLVKVASTSFALPGEEIDFTIRFDNTGNQPIGHVVILDSLSTRLEYVPGSAQCSIEAKFAFVPNEGGSLTVRCELIHPLEIGKGGVLRFRCKVR